jgi:hypothetical protein
MRLSALFIECLPAARDAPPIKLESMALAFLKQM